MDRGTSHFGVSSYDTHPHGQVVRYNRHEGAHRLYDREDRDRDMSLTHGFDSVIGAARLGAEWAWSELYKEIYPSLLAYFKIHEAPAPASAAATASPISSARSRPSATRSATTA